MPEMIEIEDNGKWHLDFTDEQLSYLRALLAAAQTHHERGGGSVFDVAAHRHCKTMAGDILHYIEQTTT